MKHILKQSQLLPLYSHRSRLFKTQKTLFKYLLYHWIGPKSTKGDLKVFVFTQNFFTCFLFCLVKIYIPGLFNQYFMQQATAVWR